MTFSLSTRVSRSLCSVLLTFSMAMALPLSSHAEDLIRFDIPAQDLGAALRAFAKAAHQQIVFDSQRVHGLTSAPLSGNYGVEDALHVLLASSGLSLSKTAGGVYYVEAKTDGPLDARRDTSASPDKGLEEIIVTAQKREERLIDVPIPVTAVTGAEIADRNITNLRDMQYAVPGLTMVQSGPGSVSIQLNGIAEASGGAQGTPVVSQYLDEMPLNKSSGSAQQPQVQLLDMDRVEVLHGPQPTLYGDGAMGGTIRYVTASPDLARFGGYVDGEWGSVTDGSNNYRGVAVLNAPLIEQTLGLRLAASYERDGGWIDSRMTGAKDVNDHDLTTVRLKVLFRPVDTVSISLLGQHEELSQPYQDFGLSDRTTAQNPSAVSEKIDLGNLVITDNLGPITILSSTGYYRDFWSNTTDFTTFFSQYLPFFYPSNVASTIKTIGFNVTTEDHVFSQELRLSSNGNERLNYLVGANYRYYVSDFPTYYVLSPAVEPPLDNAFNRSTDKSWALFGEVRYALTSRLEAQLGIRHYEDHQSATSFASGAIPGGTDVPTVVPSGTFVSNNPKVTFSYKPSGDGLIYASAAKGFRSGGTNTPSPPYPPTYGPETLWTYTLGAKQQWLDHRLNVDLAAYYNSYSNMQTQGVTAVGQPYGYVANGGRASGPGVDLALRAIPLQNLVLSATVGYTGMHFDTHTADANPGDPLDLVSKWTASVSADYSHPLTTGTRLISRIDYQYTSGYSIVIRDFPPGLWQVPSRSILNARVGLAVGKYQFSLVGSNLTDNNSPVYPAFGANVEPVLPCPRTIGVEAKATF
jgi:iron complex outermembrane receptor protein